MRVSQESLSWDISLNSFRRKYFVLLLPHPFSFFYLLLDDILFFYHFQYLNSLETCVGISFVESARHRGRNPSPSGLLDSGELW